MAQFALKSTPTLRVGCSCGKTTTITYDPTRGHFVAINPSWHFRTGDELKEGERGGWYCGAAGHNSTGEEDEESEAQ
jgi:hypothetical protein